MRNPTWSDAIRQQWREFSSHFRQGVMIPVVGAMSLLCASAEAQFVLQPNEAQSKDAKVYAFVPEMNFQSNLGVVGAGTAHSFKSLLQFDLSTMPIPAGEITLATVQLYCSSITPITDAGNQPIPDTGPGNVSLYAVTSGWTETGVTWNTFPTYNVVPVDTEYIGTAGQWYTFDVTSLVQSWQSGATTNNGFAIVMDTSMGQVAFLDSDGLTGASPNPALAPVLTVVPEPSTALLGAIGFAACATRRRRS